jgi:hypothetical protein
MWFQQERMFTLVCLENNRLFQIQSYRYKNDSSGVFYVGNRLRTLLKREMICILKQKPEFEGIFKKFHRISIERIKNGSTPIFVKNIFFVFEEI